MEKNTGGRRQIKKSNPVKEKKITKSRRIDSSL